MNEIAIQKAAFRKRMRQQVRLITPEVRQCESRTVCQVIHGSPLWAKAANVLLYVPLPDEPDISSLLSLALSEDKKLWLPRFDAALGCYKIAPVFNLQTDIAVGKFGIPEPIVDAPEPENVDIILVPGLAFAESGQRLGRGAGFYDRLLLRAVGVRCGVCWSAAVVSSIPTEPHDCRVNMLVDFSKGLRITHG